MNEIRPSVIAQPMAEHDWEVRGGNWEQDGEGSVIGFIAELGGVYEVENLTEPGTREYCGSFKAAMACFETKG